MTQSLSFLTRNPHSSKLSFKIFQKSILPKFNPRLSLLRCFPHFHAPDPNNKQVLASRMFQSLNQMSTLISKLMESLSNLPTDLMITRKRELSRRDPTRSSHCHPRRSICHWRGPLSPMKKLPLERTVRLIHRRPAVRIARSCLRTNFTTSWIESILSNSETASFELRK